MNHKTRNAAFVLVIKCGVVTTALAGVAALQGPSRALAPVSAGSAAAVAAPVGNGLAEPTQGLVSVAP